jgi:hypothetical protein
VLAAQSEQDPNMYVVRTVSGHVYVMSGQYPNMYVMSDDVG